MSALYFALLEIAIRFRCPLREPSGEYRTARWELEYVKLTEWGRFLKPS